MPNTKQILRTALLAVAIVTTAAPVMVDCAVAQENGARDRNGDRGERGGRGNWGGRRGRDGDRNDDRRNEDRPAERPAAAPAPTASSANSFGTVSDAERIRQSATETIKANDKDGNGILEGDELSKLGMSRGADKDGDGKITHNELVEFRTPKSTAAASSAKPVASTPTASQPTSTDPADRKIVNKSRKSYRFKSTKDRINNWKFSSRDANGDGQVSMSEFSRTWNDRTAREFQGYDKNSDGMITPDEAK